ncbi:MAG TPA: exodeoxyribonuclease VII large subunit [Hellea balneolensis]|uniref:Exodeoxyribonuclease 7 large subunit n=1 Tax=Hellea balneolensis TaxID=287478 RepID=A0A7C3FZR0_9PROT|nr:exodeoxyribonuclease VII large subunit [Hellea balneolensis]
MSDSTASDVPSNAHEYSVSELAFSLKRTVEEQYGRVRVRGELGRVVIAKSGHMYVDVKDDKAVIASIMWKGNVSRLSVRPEEGMEVVVEGKLTTYPGRSQYQLVIDRLEPAGVGALMALLEKRKKQFAAEGLFDEGRKKDLPYLPLTIGVVTSPTGAVIRDILHRITDRFGVRVLVWPVLVQGDKAAAQISAAITGFNHMQTSDNLPRPDLLIVARGGGSIEDLWCFNEENVVRAAAASDIPLISAIGHETDWTLLDYVADKRAPTPTGAAEMAVPVYAELLDTVEDYGLRLRRSLHRLVERKNMGLQASRLPKLDTVLSVPRQRLDMSTARLLPALDNNRRTHARALESIGARLRGEVLGKDIARRKENVDWLSRGLRLNIDRLIVQKTDALGRRAGLLEAYSYQGVLARGYALVSNPSGAVVRSAQSLAAGENVKLTFSDGTRQAVIDGAAQTSKTKPKPKKKPSSVDEKKQGDLF